MRLLIYCGGVPWSPVKSHDLGSSFPTPDVLICSVSFVISCLVRYTLMKTFTDDRKMMMIFH
jgi:hypothetical protein